MTIGWSEVDYEDNPLIAWYGYNNICLVFDTPPSTYVMPAWGCRLSFEICFETSKEVLRLSHLSTTRKIFSISCNICGGFTASFFSVCLAIKPVEDMIAHTSPFIVLLFVLPCLYLSLLNQRRSYPHGFLLGTIFFFLTSCLKVSFTLYALTSRLHVLWKFHAIDNWFNCSHFFNDWKYFNEIWN